MSNFCIDVEFLYHTSVEIEAESEDEAMEILNNMENKDIVGSEILDVYDLEDPLATNIDNIGRKAHCRSSSFS